MLAGNIKARKIFNNFMHVVIIILTVLALIPLISILSYIIYKGYRVINFEFLVSLPTPAGDIGGGIGNAILGTLILVGVASLIGLPIGIMTAIYLNEYEPKGRFAEIVRFVVDILLGIPSVVVGIFAYVAFVKPFGGFSAMSGGMALAIILIPIVTRSTEGVLKLVPNEYREGSYALGVSQWQTIIKIVIPTAMKGIVTGVMLAVARSAGETAPLLLTAFGNHYWSHSLSEPIASLPAQIFEYAKSPYTDWIEKAWGAALILIIMVLFLNITARVLTRKKY
ncbi:phosphate ABC transporter permease PstA [Clostridium lacusfryxellense]|uniref:phosphate ABC transporter permease PstA n=1 Tax=Clostridium lacusfryxellense TaxID=205328 RepID=UPI001FE96CDF|nr:phosphate ABC transporter permease PstA [Clostridium lacusfryxellense]